MCNGMNCFLVFVLFGGVLGVMSVVSGGGGEYINIISCSVEECVFIFEVVEWVVIVLGYGLVVV